MAVRIHIFETAIGPCGIAWGTAGVVGVELPGVNASATELRLRRRYADAQVAAPDGMMIEAVNAIVALIEGEARRLDFIPLDRSGHAAFHLKVWEIARGIGPGECLTYGEIARRLGDISLSRAVGQALGANPSPIIVPCHRVLAADGRSGGFSGAGGVETKLRLLNIERAALSSEPLLFGDLPLATRAKGR